MAVSESLNVTASYAAAPASPAGGLADAYSAHLGAVQHRSELQRELAAAEMRVLATNEEWQKALAIAHQTLDKVMATGDTAPGVIQSYGYPH